MLKWVNYDVVMAEVPNEITLAINISNCPCHCPGCHTSILSRDIGVELNESQIDLLLKANKGVTCVAFMGGDSEPSRVNELADYVKYLGIGLHTAWYSGRQELSHDIDLKNFNYIKLGPYVESLGPLNKPTTNQRFYEVVLNREVSEDFEEPTYGLNDITNVFWKHGELDEENV